jgi:hypothetical protein
MLLLLFGFLSKDKRKWRRIKGKTEKETEKETEKDLGEQYPTRRIRS